MRALLAVMLFALSGPTGAQAPPPPAAPASPPAERSAPGESKLNLNLDDNSRRQILRDLPAERGAASSGNTLPGLGASDARAPSAFDKRPFPNSGLDPAPTAPLPR